MKKSLGRTLNAEAPSWLQAFVYGVFAAALVFGLAAFVLTMLIESFSLGDAEWLIPLGIALLFLAAYLPWAIPRVTVLRDYTAALGEDLGEPAAATRGRVWSLAGPGWRITGLAPLFFAAVTVTPLAILYTFASAPFDAPALGAATDLVLRGFIVVAGAALIGVAVGTALRPSQTVRLLIDAARRRDDRASLVEEAVQLTHGVYPKTRLFWIAQAFSTAWALGYVYNQLTTPLNLPVWLSVGIWLALSVPLTAVMVRSARRRGAPRDLWIGVAILVGWSLVWRVIVYGSFWNLFGTLIAEGAGGDWPTPAEFARQSTISLLAKLPMVTTAWLASTRGNRERPASPLA